MIQGQLWKIHFVIHDVPWQLYTIRFIDTAMASFHRTLQWMEEHTKATSPGIIPHKSQVLWFHTKKIWHLLYLFFNMASYEKNITF